MSILSTSLSVVFGAVGTYLLLPHRHGAAHPRRQYTFGAIAARSGAAGHSWLLMSPPGPFLPTVFFYIFSAAARSSALS